MSQADRRMTGLLQHAYGILLSLFVVFNFLCSNSRALASSLSWINEDPLGHPQYELLLLKELMANSTTTELIAGTERKSEDSKSGEVVSMVSANSQISISRDESPSQESDYITMRTAKGQLYLCHIPSVSSNTELDNNINEEDEDEIDILKRGLALLEPMKDDCLSRPRDWFTYEYCHLRYARQYHKIQGNLKEEIYILGKYDSSGTALPSSDDHVEENSQSIQGASLERIRGGRKIVQKLSGGTTCDKTKKPRQIKIEFLCEPNTMDSIAYYEEESICSYHMIIHTPRLCDDPAFHDKAKSVVHPINCNPIVSDANYEKMSKERSLDGPSEETAGTASKDKSAIVADGLSDSVKEEVVSKGNIQFKTLADLLRKIEVVKREEQQDEETFYKLVLTNEEMTVIQSMTEDDQKHHSKADLTHQARLSKDYEVVYETSDEKNNGDNDK
ncbi:3072_t:CDS:2 [Paraglomus occultum]|uniref:Protein OS-9 homolog n=1 Tax=Paraglomus occultum TaxID=144539 RepID=A0A9N9AYC2_9GLOM|nr:3072_t:CDS:2 [Paraglomus occultum]